MILYDYAIHYFDALSTFIADREPTRIFASFTKTKTQRATNPMLAQAMVEFDGAQATLIFDADLKSGHHDRTFVAGTNGTIVSSGPSLNEQKVTLYLPDGNEFSPKLTGRGSPTDSTARWASCSARSKKNACPATTPATICADSASAMPRAHAEDGKPKSMGEVRKMSAN